MLKLLKYELRKTITAKLVLLGLSVLLEGLFLFMLLQNKTGGQSITLIAMMILGLFSVIFIDIQSILSLHRDMNTRQGYMLFMTPNSSCRILGAKVLENGISTLLAGAFYVGLCYADITLLRNHNQSVEEALSFLNTLLESSGTGITMSITGIISLIFNGLCGCIMTVVLAYFADIIASSLLNGKRGGLLICFVLFIILSIGEAKLAGLIVPAINSAELHNVVLGVFYIALSAITYFVASKMMDHHLSV